jgi:hypothetical protein
VVPPKKAEAEIINGQQNRLLIEAAARQTFNAHGDR